MKEKLNQMWRFPLFVTIYTILKYMWKTAMEESYF